MLHQTLEINSKGRDFVVGDLHGMYDQLLDMMNKHHFNPDADRLLSVGDLIDRGPDSIKCLELLDTPWFYAIQGNHERLMIDGLLHGQASSYSTWLANGGAWSLEEDDEALNNWARRLDDLPVTLTVNQEHGLPVGIVHAEYPLPTWADRMQLTAITDKDLQPLLWSRQRIRSDFTTHIEDLKALYVGHTPVHDVKQLGNCHYIDLGCYQSGQLAMIEI